MRVLHLYAGNLYGGIERNLAAVAELRNLAPGMEPGFGLCFEGRLARELRGFGAAVFPLGAVRTRYPWQVRAIRRRVGKLLADGAWDVVLTQSCWGQGLFAPAARAAGVPQVLFLNNLVGGERRWEAWARGNRPDRLLAASQAVAASATRLYPDLAAHLVYAPVSAPTPNPADRERLRRELATNAGDTVILMAARLEPNKGFDLFLEALGRLHSDSGWTAWVAGGVQRPREERYLRACRERARRLGIEPRVRWLGERADVEALMGAADLFCHPNLQPEALGRVMAEAMLAGTPVIASALGGTLEIVTPETGELIEPRPEALAASLAAWMADPARRHAAGAAAPARARALFDPLRALARLEAELRAACATRIVGAA